MYEFRIKKIDDPDRFTKTCLRGIDKTFGYMGSGLYEYNTYMEFWAGRKFIGGCWGDVCWDEIYIDHFFVSERHRNKGYGSKMMELLKGTYHHIMVESTPEAEEFYKKCGFKKRRCQDRRIYNDTINMHYKKSFKYEKGKDKD